MKRIYLLKIYLSIIGLCLWSVGSMAQGYSVTTTAQCNTTSGGSEVVDFTSATPTAVGDGTLTAYFRGDFDLSTEYADFYGETGPILGTTTTTAQCDAAYDSITITIPMADINAWASDGIISFTADASSSVSVTCTGSMSFCVYMKLEYPRASGLNDIGIASVDAPTVFCAGSQNILVTVQNYGLNQVTSGTVNWTWNGVAQTPLTIAQLIDTAQGTNPNNIQLMLGTKTITNKDTLVVWTSAPNGGVDTTNINDTITVIVAPALSGTFTIGGASPDYTSFSAAVADFAAYGICGPVVLNVASGSGPYNEQVDIPEITGSSAANTITINGNGETLTFGGSSSSYPTLNLDGADYITVNDLNIEASGSSNSWALHLMNNADNNSFNNCNFSASMTSTSSTTGCVSMSGSTTSYSSAGNNGSNNTFTNCSTLGGYFGFALYGSSPASGNVGNSIVNSKISDFYYYGIYNLQQSGVTISGNTVHRPTRTSVSSGYTIYLSTGCENSLIEKNKITNLFGGNATSTSVAYPIYITGDASAGTENKVYNNLIYDLGGNGTHYALYLSGDYIHAYHNTIALNTTSSTSGTTRGIYSAGAGAQIMNNDIYITRGGTGTKHCLYFTGGSQVSDNNNLYMGSSAGSNNIGYYSGNYATLTGAGGWQSANGGIWDQNSKTTDPQYAGSMSGDYTPGSFQLDNTGAPVGVATDITGAARSATTPDIGAYEFSIPACAGQPIGGDAYIDGSQNVSACLNQPLTLTLANYSTDNGISIQWEESFLGLGMWTPIAGATTASFGITFTTDMEYRAVVTCINGGQSATSTPVMVTSKPFYSCYCSPLTGVSLQTSAGTNYVTDVGIIGTPLLVTTTAVGSGGYMQHDMSIASNTATLSQAMTYTLYAVHSSTTNYINSELWIDWDQSGTFDSAGAFGMEYIPAAATGPVDTFNIQVPVAGLTGPTGMRLRVLYSTTVQFGPNGACDGTVSTARETEDFVVTIAPPPTCIPSGLPTVGSVTAATAMASWPASPSNPAMGYEWQVFLQGAGQTGTPVSSGVEAAGSTSANITNLSAITTYTFYVRAICSGSDQSTWMSVDFTTPCAAFMAPWTDDVESQTANTNSVMANCWNSNPTNQTGVYAWHVTGTGTTGSLNTGPNYAHSGSKYFFTEASYGTTGATSELMTPQIDVSALTLPTLEFWYHMYGTDIDKLLISVDGGSGWVVVDSIVGEQQTSETAPWIRRRIYLTGYTGIIQVKFTGVRGATFYADMSIDDIAVVEAPTCPDPTSLTATNITLTSADLGWTSNSSATQYEIEYGQGNTFALGTGTRVGPAGVANPYNLGGLTAATQYSFFVREICGPGDTSAWSSRASFTTLFPVPPNDLCANAIDISNGQIINGYVNNATQSEPACDATVTANDVWYVFTTGATTTSATINANTTNTGTDLVMQVYSGTCGTLTALTPTSSSGSSSCVDGPAAGLEYGTYAVTPNTTYYVRVYGYLGDQGTFDIQFIEPPANDDVCSATTLIVDDPNISWVNTTNATTSTSDPALGTCTTPDHNVWYKFTTGAAGTYYVNVFSPPVGTDNMSAWLWLFSASGTCPSLTFTLAQDINQCANAAPASSPVPANASWSAAMPSLVASTTYYLIADGNSTSFGNIGFSITSFPLAIKLVNVTAENIGSKNRVNWVTGEEKIGDYFELERSADGKNFATVTSMKANGEASTYTYVDEQPFSGKTFYRLKMYEANGNYEYSKVVTATMNGKAEFSVRAYPNPVGDGQLTVEAYGTDGNNATVMITDITGKVIKVVTMPNGIATIDMNGMAQGIYLVKYTDSHHSQTIKVNKQ